MESKLKLVKDDGADSETEAWKEVLERLSQRKEKS